MVVVAGGLDGDSPTHLVQCGFGLVILLNLPVISSKTAKTQQPTSLKKKQIDGKLYVCKGNKKGSGAREKKNQNHLPELRKLITSEHIGPLHPTYIPMAP